MIKFCFIVYHYLEFIKNYIDYINLTKGIILLYLSTHLPLNPNLRNNHWPFNVPTEDPNIAILKNFPLNIVILICYVFSIDMPHHSQVPWRHVRVIPTAGPGFPYFITQQCSGGCKGIKKMLTTVERGVCILKWYIIKIK